MENNHLHNYENLILSAVFPLLHVPNKPTTSVAERKNFSPPYRSLHLEVIKNFTGKFCCSVDIQRPRKAFSCVGEIIKKEINDARL